MFEKDKSSDKIVENLKNIDFSCQRCSNCCRKEPGAVFLTENDVHKLAKNLNMAIENFLKECCRSLEKDGKFVAVLKEKSNYDCIFWNDGCIVYEDRPYSVGHIHFGHFWLRTKKWSN